MNKINTVSAVTQLVFSKANGTETNRKGKNGSLNIFMGDTAMGRDPYQQKIESARKKAMKLVKDAFRADQDYSKSMKEIKDIVVQKRTEQHTAMSDIKEAEQNLSALREEYGVDPESQEQKDLEWLQAYHRGKTAPKSVEQMVEDKKKAEKITANLTEYQSRALETDSQIRNAQERYDDAEQTMIAAAQSLTDAKIDKLKDQSMIKAQESGEMIMEAASKEVISDLWAEGKEKIDQKVEEEQEKKKEEKKEEEKAEEIAERRAEEEAVRESMIEKNSESVQEAKARVQEKERDTSDLGELLQAGVAQMTVKNGEAGSALDDLKHKMALIDADLKGLLVDDTV